MINKKTLGFIFQVPLLLVVISSFIASIYVIVKKLYPISIVTPFILGAIILMYFIGGYLKRRRKNEWLEN